MIWALIAAGAGPLRNFLRVGAPRARSFCGGTQVGNLCYYIARAGTATELFGINEDLAHAEC